MSRRLIGSRVVACSLAMSVASVGIIGVRVARAETSSDIIRRHFGTLTVNGVAAVGERPLAVALLDFEDQPMPQNRPYYDWLWFGRGSPFSGLRAPANVKSGNVWRAFLENSYGQFRWGRAGLFGPYRYPDDPLTTADESQWACVLKPEDCAGMGVVTIQTDNRRNFLRVAGSGGPVNAAGTDPGRNEESFSLIDINGIPLVDGDEVNLMSFHGHYLGLVDRIDGLLRGDRTKAGSDERFRLIKRSGSGGSIIRHGDRIAIQAANGRHLSAENGGGGRVAADRFVIGAWEHFTLFEQAHNNARTLRTAMELSAPELDFARFDADNDSVVEEHELAFSRVLSTGTGWGQQGRYLGAIRPAGAKIDVRPSTVVFDAFAGLDTIVHELAHALEVEHVYGSQSNSQDLTPMGATVAGPADVRDGEEWISWDEYDRERYHLDPWTKFRLGWLSPQILRLGVDNTCRRIAAADTDDVAYTQGTGPDRPALYYDAARPNEYYFVEYRKRGGYDAEVASEGVAVWLIMVDDRGDLIQSPGHRITPGPDGIFQSRVLGDDVQLEDMITSGLDRWLDSVFDARDARAVDPVNISLGAPTSTWGGARLWTSADGVFRPMRSTQTPSNLWLQVGEPAGASVEVESAPGPWQPTLGGISPTVAPTGTLFTIRGNLGVRGTKRVEARNRATGVVYTGAVQSWQCARAEVRFKMPDGVYDVSVVGDDPDRRSASQPLVIFPLRLL